METIFISNVIIEAPLEESGRKDSPDCKEMAVTEELCNEIPDLRVTCPVTCGDDKKHRDETGKINLNLMQIWN